MGAERLLMLYLLLAPLPAAAADRPVSIRVGNLANKGELARFERRVREGCGQEARIRVERRASDKPAGRVIGQYPQRGTRIGCDHAAATLHVSAGPAQASLFVPALIDPAQRRAFSRQLRDVCGVPVAITEIRRPSFLPPDRFVEQTPAQGMRYACGDPVEVRLSAGPRGEALAAAPRAASPRAARPAQVDPRSTASTPQPVPSPSVAPVAVAPPAILPTQYPAAAPQPAPPATVEIIDPATIPQTPATTPRYTILGPSLVLLLLAALLVPLMLRRLAPRPGHAPAAAATQRPSPAPPLVSLLALERGWPTATAQLLPVPHTPSGPPVDALPPVPLLRDLLRPLDPALDWIADTPLAVLGALADPNSGGPGTHTSEDAETLVPLRPAFAEALRFALLFELPPLLARAWAQAPDLPFQPGCPQRGWCSLTPHAIEVAVTPDLNLTAAGLPVARPALRLRLNLTFPAARLYLRGAALDAFEPGAVHVSATLEWAGQSRPLDVLRPHAAWPGQLAVTPPLQLHALPALIAVG